MMYSKFVFLTSLCVAANAAVIFDNGPLVTHPGAGAGGADVSRLQNSTLGMGNIGFTASDAGALRLADDFTVTGGGWQIDSITVFGYQTGSTATSTFDFGSLRIWSGRPASGGVIVFGDTTTNRLASTSWSNIYRELESAPGGTDRPIMANTLTVGAVLAPGVYWIDFNLGGTLGSGPFVPPVTILGQTNTGDALQFNGTTWNAVTDIGAQGIPFQINSDTGNVPEPSSFFLATAGAIALALIRRRR